MNVIKSYSDWMVIGIKWSGLPNQIKQMWAGVWNEKMENDFVNENPEKIAAPSLFCLPATLEISLVLGSACSLNNQQQHSAHHVLHMERKSTWMRGSQWLRAVNMKPKVRQNPVLLLKGRKRKARETRQGTEWHIQQMLSLFLVLLFRWQTFPPLSFHFCSLTPLQ